MKDKHNIESLWRSTIKTLFVVAFGILLYELLENISSVRSAVSGFFSVITPIFIGIAIAFIANMPMHFLEAAVFHLEEVQYRIVEHYEDAYHYCHVVVGEYHKCQAHNIQYGSSIIDDTIESQYAKRQQHDSIHPHDAPIVSHNV